MANSKNDKLVTLSLEKFAKLQGELLNLERSCEVERAQDLVRAHCSDARELEKRGLALRRVQASESRTGLYGRTVVSYCKEKAAPLPATSISNGKLNFIFYERVFIHEDLKFRSGLGANKSMCSCNLFESSLILFIITVSISIPRRRGRRSFASPLFQKICLGGFEPLFGAFGPVGAFACWGFCPPPSLPS
jgi:hypothetical protein